jgi:hypothetical protein
MQLDRTSIVIAQRSADELLDLSLAVIRAYWRRLLPLAIAGVAPFAILNLIFLWPITDYEQLVIASREGTSPEGFRIRYLWTMMTMVFVQAPLAMAGVSYFLGQAVFIEEPRLAQVAGVLGRRIWPLFLVLGVYRGGLVSIAYAAWLFADPSLYSEWSIAFYGTVAVIAFYLGRCFRPFAPEILLLERCPLRKRRSDATQAQTYSKRSAWIHAGSGDLFSIQTTVSFVAVVFILAMCAGSLFFNGALIGRWNWGWWMDIIFFPAILWAMALWDAVIRFLLYLNTRIRLEGWELHLRLNAELNRLLDVKS